MKRSWCINLRKYLGNLEIRRQTNALLNFYVFSSDVNEITTWNVALLGRSEVVRLYRKTLKLGK